MLVHTDCWLGRPAEKRLYWPSTYSKQFLLAGGEEPGKRARCGSRRAAMGQCQGIHPDGTTEVASIQTRVSNKENVTRMKPVHESLRQNPKNVERASDCVNNI